jgi:hypothetical protein
MYVKIICLIALALLAQVVSSSEPPLKSATLSSVVPQRAVCFTVVNTDFLCLLALNEDSGLLVKALYLNKSDGTKQANSSDVHIVYNGYLDKGNSIMFGQQKADGFYIVLTVTGSSTNTKVMPTTSGCSYVLVTGVSQDGFPKFVSGWDSENKFFQRVKPINSIAAIYPQSFKDSKLDTASSSSAYLLGTGFFRMRDLESFPTSQEKISEIMVDPIGWIQNGIKLGYFEGEVIVSATPIVP